MRLSTVFISFKPQHVCVSSSATLCYGNISVWPVIPLKGTRPEATQVWETVLCWLNFSPALPHPSSLSLPAQPALPATSVCTGDRASTNQNRALRLKTQDCTILNIWLWSLDSSQKFNSSAENKCTCLMWAFMWEEERGGQEVEVKRF